MKKPVQHLMAAAVAAFMLTACGGGDEPVSKGPPMVVNQNGESTFDTTALGQSLAALPTETLTAAEQASLTYIREEEKLAHDVYVQLGTLWGGQTKVFGNIATSEATHTEAVRQLLLRYDLTDPAATAAAGVFQNPDLQALYTDLVAQGSASLVAALQVGAAIEELDLLDIQEAMLEIDNQDIRLVYENLLKGSRNHLRSFVKVMGTQGMTYEPQRLSVDDYNAIVSTPIER